MNGKEIKSATVAGSAAPQGEFTLIEVSRACAVETGFVVELVQEGVISPHAGQAPDEWRFAGSQLRPVSVAARLQRDLGVNLAGAALALQLLDEVETLRAQLTASASESADD